MPQQYRQRSERRNITLEEIGEMTELEVMKFIAKARWGSESNQVCPDCGSFDSHYYRKTRKQWLCKHCGHTFSLTSGTVFAYIKFNVKKLLQIFFIFCNSAKGTSANEMLGLINLSHRAAWVVVQKIREGLLRSRDETPLSGMVHIDGAYFGGKRRHGRIRKYKINHKHYEAKIASKGKKKLPMNATPVRNAIKRRKNRRVVLVFREVGPNPNDGVVKTRATVVRSEKEEDIREHIKRFVVPGSTIWTDDHGAYNHLSENYNHSSVEHSKEFMTVDGVHNNHAESFFSRLRRAELGIFHGMRSKYLMEYVQEMVWKDDMRRKSLLEQLNTLVCKVFSVGDSAWWRGYQQGQKRNDELLNF